jgi:hypothetical protein
MAARTDFVLFGSMLIAWLATIHSLQSPFNNKVIVPENTVQKWTLNEFSFRPIEFEGKGENGQADLIFIAGSVVLEPTTLEGTR